MKDDAKVVGKQGRMSKRCFDLNVLNENMRVYRLEKSKYSSLDFNNRPYDFFHIFSTNYNPGNIKKITKEDIKTFFPKPECSWCSGRLDPRPMDCSMSDICKFKDHKRGTAKDPGIGPLMESRLENSPILLSRANFSWLLDNPEIEFIVRGTISNNWVFHHKTLDRFNDSPGMIKIVNRDWHMDTHRQLKNCVSNITNLEASLSINKNETDEKELALQIKIKEHLIKRLTTVDNDPDIMRLLYEINDRLKSNMI